MKASSHATPVDWRTLRNYVIKEHGAEFVRQPGTTHVTMRLPNGNRLGLVGGQKAVTTRVMRDVAAALGMGYVELRAAIGAPIAQRGKGRISQGQTKPKPFSRPDVRRLIDKLRFEINELEQELERDRDPSVYRSMGIALTAAVQDVSHHRYQQMLIREHVKVS